MNNRISRLVAMIALTGVLAVSCSSNKAPSPSAGAGASPAAPGQTAKAETPKRGGTAVVIRGYVPLGFDPHFTLTQSAFTYAAPVFSQLVRIDPTKGYPVTAADIVGDLAERWEISSDGKVMTFMLRKGVKWHNGTPFTSKDAKFSIERMADPKKSFFAGDFADLQGVDTPDDFTVRVNWKVTSAGKLGIFATGYSAVMSADFVPGKDPKKEEFAMGTGPFKLAGFAAGKEYRYERYKDYHIEGRPYLDGLVVKVVTSDASLPAMISGQGDTCTLLRGCISSQENYELVQSKAPNLKLGTNRVPRPLGRAVYFNTSVPGPMQSVEVRRALALVIDRDSVIARYGGKDWAIASGFFLPGMALDLAEVDKLIGWDKPMADRVTEAKALMAKAGYASGFKETALVRNTVEYVEVMTLITESWKKHLNVDVKLDAPETAAEVDRRSRFDYHMVWYFPTLRAGIHPSELASQFICKAPENWARYCNPEIDGIFAKLGGVAGGAEAKALARQAETILLREMPGVPLLFPVDISLSKADVKGIVTQPWVTNEDYSTIWLDR